MILRNKYMVAYEERIVKNSYRNHVLAEMVREGNRRGYYVILLLERLKHLKLVSERLPDIPHRIVAGVDYQGEKLVMKKGKMVRKVIGDKIEVRDRQKMTKRFEAGTVKVILANKVFAKGVNIKRVDVLIDGTASKSKDGAMQKFGRGVRLHPDKSGLIYFDLSDVDEANKKNWFARAARSRKRAFVAAGLTVKDFVWEQQGEVVELYDKAEKLLRLELIKTSNNWLEPKKKGEKKS